MDKKIEKMRETIKRKNQVLLAMICLTSALSVLFRRESVLALAKTQTQGDFVHGFMAGMAIAIDLACVFLLATIVAGFYYTRTYTGE